MLHTEQLTPAQAALLEFVDPLNAGDLYDYIHQVLQSSMAGTGNPEQEASTECRDAWYFTVQLLKHIKNIALENTTQH